MTWRAKELIKQGLWARILHGPEPIEGNWKPIHEITMPKNLDVVFRF